MRIGVLKRRLEKISGREHLGCIRGRTLILGSMDSVQGVHMLVAGNFFIKLVYFDGMWPQSFHSVSRGVHDLEGG